MKNKKEFLTRGKGNFINCTDYDDAIKAMEELAIGFAEYIAENGWRKLDQAEEWSNGEVHKTTSEIYHLYLYILNL